MNPNRRLNAEHRLSFSISSTKVVVAESDAELRYVWIVNPHPDFDVEKYMGKRDDELDTSESSRRLTEMKRWVVETGESMEAEVPFTLSNGRRVYDFSLKPLRDKTGMITGVSSVAVDVAERVNTQQTLQHANRKKTEFLSVLAHEIKNSAYAVSLVLSQDRNQPEKLVRDIDTVSHYMEQLVRLANDLMCITSIEKGRLLLKTHRIDLRGVVDDAIRGRVTELEKTHHLFDIYMPGDPIIVEADPDRLLQVFNNLLANAIRYTPEGGRIQVKAWRDDRRARVSIRDNGIGIPPDKLENIFNIFEQLDRFLDAGDQGLGIGLSVARSLAELHGGGILARSEGENRGCEFTVWLPGEKALQ